MDSIKINQVVVGMLEVNVYILVCSSTGETVIIDPGDEAERIMDSVNEAGGKQVSWLLHTHAHGDHIGATRDLAEMTGAKIGIHESEADFLTDASLNLSKDFYIPVTAPEADWKFKNKEVLKFGNQMIKIHHTPGHSPGCCCFLVNKNLFTGDTLFRGSIGRTDFSHSSPPAMQKSLEIITAEFSPKTIIYPGHGPSSTMAEEFKTNPFLNFYSDASDLSTF